MTIQQALQAILDEPYGHDVLSAVCEGLSLCYDGRAFGGYHTENDLASFWNGVALFPAATSGRPFDAPFVVVAAGSSENDEYCCQMAFDATGVNPTQKRTRSGGYWSNWGDATDHTAKLLRYYTYNGGTLLQQQTILHGGNGTYSGQPSRDSNAQYTYTFLGWSTSQDSQSASSNATKAITADRRVYAAYRWNLRSYTVRFFNGTSQYGSSQTVYYGSNATAPSTNPSKSSTAQYNYIFKGWALTNGQSSPDANALLNITGARDIYAAYENQLRYYDVKFYNGSTLLSTVSTGYGANANYDGATPTKESTSQYTYSWNGWTTDPNGTTPEANALTNITGARNVYATFAANVVYYTVTFMNGSTKLNEISVAYGENAVYSGATPAKASTAQYSYAFQGWTTTSGGTTVEANALKNITANRTVYAVYSQTVRSYTVTFMNGETQITTAMVTYGSDASYSGLTPTKASTDQYSYTFAGWTTTSGGTTVEANALKTIQSDRTVYAVFTEGPRMYDVRFMNGSTQLGDAVRVAYGETAYYSGTTPSKTSTAQYAYTFVGWATTDGQSSATSGILENITSDKTVYAAFSATTRTYTVRFMNGTTVLQTNQNVPYGSSVTYSGTTPVHPEDPTHYEFIGWDPEPNSITGDTDCQPVWLHTASITRQIINRTISGMYENSTISSIGAYAFVDCASLTGVFCESATEIGSCAFLYCTSLSSAYFPQLTSLGYAAFENCYTLPSVAFSKVTVIESWALAGCSSLSFASFESAATVSYAAFAQCSFLTSISLPNAVTISADAFAWCTALPKISLPMATTIREGAFSRCTSLSVAVIGTGQSGVCVLSGSSVFYSTHSALSIYVPDSLVESYKLATNWAYLSSRIFGVSQLPNS